MSAVKPTEVIPIFIQLFDNDTTKFIRATATESDGTALTGSPYSLTHIADGFYDIQTVVMPDTPAVRVQYVVFDDAGFTTISSLHSSGVDTFTRLVFDDEFAALLAALLAAITAIDVSTGDLEIIVLDEDTIKMTISDDDEFKLAISDDDEVALAISDDDEISVSISDTDEFKITIKEC